MNFSKLTISERRQIVNGIIMENKNISHIQNNVMDIISILNKEDIIELFKLLIPNSAFKIIDSKNKVIIEYTPSWTPCDYWTSYWYKKYSTYYADNCVAPGENICMRYVPCDR
ncbi:MAG: hypothetical protein R2739_05785 [Chitinophagales bacterium]|nr:hypothetical protein [Bacteroidota bacterium]